MNHAIDHWRKQFRGEARVKHDTDVTDADIAATQPRSSAATRTATPSSPKSPTSSRSSGTTDGIKLGDETFPADHHVPVLIFPNPLNPKRYVVLNSGFTFREYDYLNNARQVPKLPDYAIVDISKPITSRAPGDIAAAGFFNEHWELK